MEVGFLGQLGSEGDDSDVDALRRMENVEEIASLEQRWGNSWTTSLKTRCAPVSRLSENILD
jgi:dynactin-4